MRKAQKFKVQAIQKEQVQLVQIEKYLETLLGNINESINTLKVEELQLKSSLVEHFTNSQEVENEKPTTSLQAQTILTNLEPETGSIAAYDDCLIDESINKQLLDLETLLVPMKRKTGFGEDEEEDEEEMDDEEFLPE